MADALGASALFLAQSKTADQMNPERVYVCKGEGSQRVMQDHGGI